MSLEQDAIRLVRPADPISQAEKPSKLYRYDRAAEITLRNAVEAWGRTRWPDARVVHELVMDRGSVRLDVGFVCPERLIVVEVKSGYDTTERLLHQTAMARLCANEVWIVADPKHGRDIGMARHLLPSVGHLTGAVDAALHGLNLAVAHEALDPPPVTLSVTAEPEGTLAPVPEMMLALCWVAELEAIAGRTRVALPRKPTHAATVRELARVLTADEITAQVCRALRGRDCLWRADPPIPSRAATAAPAPTGSDRS